MKHRISTLHVPRGAAAALAVTALAAGAALALPSVALADGTVGTISRYKSSNIPLKVKKDYTDCNELIKDISKYATESGVTKVAVSVDTDWTTNTRIDIPAGSNVVLRLNGHMINRNKATVSFEGTTNGEVIVVRKNATLTVEGGDKSITHYGSLDGTGNTFWHKELNGSTAITGGLITGGAASGTTAAGGGITMLGDKAKVYLNDVTVAGNVADTFQGSNGCGGGICVNGDSSTLELKNSSVSFNHAVSDGGGIYVYGNDSTVKIDNYCRIDNNFSEDEGGGIAHSGKRGSVTVSGGSRIAYNIAEMRGGGVYSYYNGTTFTLDASEVSYNDAGQGEWSIFKNSKYKGGGFFFEDVSTLNLKNGALISNNTATGGAGVYVNDDDTTVSLSGASKIKGNIAADTGGGVALSDDNNKLVLSEGSQICENVASYGAGIELSSRNFFTASDMTVELSGNSSICNNRASHGGGGIYSSRGVRKDTLVVKSTDGTGTISGNTAEKGGAAYIEDADFVLQDISMTGNCVTEEGGAIVFFETNQLVQSGSGRITLKGTVKVTDNYCNGNASNIAFAMPLKGDASNPLSKDSRIGVSYYSKSWGNSDKKVTENTDILKNIGNDFDSVFFADDADKHVIKRTDGLLYIEDGATKHTLKILGGGDDTTYLSYIPNDMVSLKSASFPKPGYTLDYWELETGDSKETYYPVNGVTTFKMPGYDTTVRAHYASHLSNLRLTVRDTADWDKLGADPNSAHSSSVNVYAVTGENYGFTLASEVSQAFLVKSVDVKETDDGGKEATYTVKMLKDSLDTLGMCYVENEFENAVVNVRASFGSALTREAKVTEDADGNLIITATVKFSGTGKAVKVSAVNANKADGTAFDNVTELVNGLDSTTSADGLDMVILTPPDQPGWEFVKWQGLPEGAAEDPETHMVTMDKAAAEGAEIVALYKPLASTISLTVDDLVVGEPFPTTVKECKVAGAAERDISEYISDDAKVTWTKADGSAVGDVVEGDTEYEGTITTSVTTSTDYLFGFSDSVYITVNGEEASADQSGSTISVKNVFFKVRTKSDARFDSVVNGDGVSNIYSMDELDSALPKSISYKLKSGAIKAADVTWDTDDVDKSQTNGAFEVTGTFKDVNGESHTVSQFVYFAVMDAPKATYEQAADGTGTQYITFSPSGNWKQGTDYTIYCNVVKYDGLSEKDFEPSNFSAYNGAVEIKAGYVCIAYAKLKGSDGTESDSGVEVYGRSLEFAKVTASKVAYGSEGLEDSVTVKLDGKKLVQGVDYEVDYSTKAAAGQADAVIYATDEASFTGYKLFSYKVTPTKVAGVKAAKAGKGKAKVSWTEHKAQTSGFQVRYAASKAKLAKGKTVKVKGAAKKAVTLKGLKSGKKVFVQVRAYKTVDGKTYWSDWSKVAACKVK